MTFFVLGSLTGALLGWLMGFLSLFLILLVLIQRGKGGGLTGALGGPGGHSAFGSKAGDTFTVITVVVASVWAATCAFTMWLLGTHSPTPVTDSAFQAAPGDEADERIIPPVESEEGTSGFGGLGGLEGLGSGDDESTAEDESGTPSMDLNSPTGDSETTGDADADPAPETDAVEATEGEATEGEAGTEEESTEPPADE